MKKGLFVILIFSLLGCASTKMFVEERNYDVGRKVDFAYLADPIEITSYDEKLDKHLYSWDNSKCKFYYLVDKETKIVESWHYISEVKNCMLGFDWFGPW